MQYGYIVTNFGYCGDPHTLVDLARTAEDAGWDGFFTWDHLQFPGQEPTADPWVALAAIAARTERIRIGPMITPIPRRHIAKLARESTTLDHLSRGRLILGIGAGAPELPEYTAFGDRGEHYTVVTDGFGRPFQKPRIPVWVAATWPYKPPFRRAARWDGVYPIHRDSLNGHVFTPAELSDLVAYVRAHRVGDGPYDVCMFGATRDARDTGTVVAYAKAGATWWHDYSVPWLSSLDDVRTRLRNGPPRI